MIPVPAYAAGCLAVVPGGVPADEDGRARGTAGRPGHGSLRRRARRVAQDASQTAVSAASGVAAR